MLDLLQHRVRQRGWRKSSPESSRIGRRLVCATPAAVTMLVAPGPIELVATMIWRRFFALAIGDAGQRHRLLVLAAPGRQVVLDRLERLAEAGDVAVAEDREHAARTAAASVPSITVRCAQSQRTSACAIVSRTVFMATPPRQNRSAEQTSRGAFDQGAWAAPASLGVTGFRLPLQSMGRAAPPARDANNDFLTLRSF